ncbi:MAG: DsbA family protein, partial [Pseudomonadota bacterium]|nr:DsbA family protein [Pseudomonadota bacterium]
GKEERLRKKLFDAVQHPRTPLFSDAALRAYVVKQGIDGTSYDAMANSFAVQSKMQRALLLMGKYQLSGVPNLVVDGRFVTSPALASRGAPRADAKKDNPATLHVLDDLLARVKAERPAPPAAVPTHAPTARAKPRVLPRRHPTAHLRAHR